MAPTIIHTFLESYDFGGKTLIPFATSGSSGLGKTEEVLKNVCGEGVVWKDGRMLNDRFVKEELVEWVKDIGV
jgi:hypothetical protein